MKQQLQEALRGAMKAKDKTRLDTIRALVAAIQYEEMEKKTEPLPKEACIAVLQREAKRRKEELDFAKQGNRGDLIPEVEAQLKIIEEFLPQQMTEESIARELTKFKEVTPGANMGAAMKFLKDKFAGQYDSKAASDTAKKIFA